MPEPPVRALELVAILLADAADALNVAASLASQALEQLAAGPPGATSTLLATALGENVRAQDRTRVTIAGAAAMWREAIAVGRAIERASAAAEREKAPQSLPRLMSVREPATTG